MADPLTFEDLGSRGVEVLDRIGPKRLAALRSMELGTVLDLLFHYPRRYLDRTKEARLADLVPGDEAMVLGRVTSVASRRARSGKVMVVAEVSDPSGRMKVTFFNQPWRERQLAGAAEAVFFGKLEVFRGARQMTNPVVDLIGDRTGRIIPVYPQSEKAGLTSWEIGDAVGQVLRRVRPRGLLDPVPARVLDDLGLIPRAEAFAGIHEPQTMSEVVEGRRRLVFDELLRIQLALVGQKRAIENEAVGISHPSSPEGGSGLLGRFVAGLPYQLTGAQQGAIAEIAADLSSSRPMHRLLQGDVGAGKTVVALAALLVAVQGDHQGAFMAPTEVLAEQHAAGLVDLLDGLVVADDRSLFGERSVEVALLTNRTSAADRRRILAGLEGGLVDILVGTHALIQEKVRFRSLGVAVIDEQHRFGVHQRDALRTANDDGTVPDVLVMTATPIPRTAAMTVYGDLDVSVLGELPPGRTPIDTTWARSDEEVAAVWGLVRAEVAGGHQAYVVCPLVEESEKLEAASAVATHAELDGGELAGLRLGLLHGRVTGDDKEVVMGAFRRGELDVLVATTVIEVGVDVPNATVMVILDADRFGIAQLHQLRGRVGRGSAESHCALIAADPTGDGEARLEALVATTDGFELAEVDLELRGEGTIMGERQKGRNDLKLASLRRDREWVERAREVAFELVGDGTGLADHPDLAAEVRYLLGEADTEFLLKN